MLNHRVTRFALNYVVMLLGLMPNASTLAAEPVQFNRDIRPILANHCFQCHGPDSPARKGGLRLDQRDHAIAPAESGSSAIVPNQPDASELVNRILAADAETVMPPPEVAKPLTPQQKDLLKQWIEEGAQYEAHWSFIAPQRQDLPKVQQTDWPRNEIDHFILARLEGESLHPAPEAELATLVRRLSLDLTGLPPTPTDVDAFLAEMNAASIAENTATREGATTTGDTATSASKSQTDAVFLRWVNRYLDSPHYGERMAVDWLDAARFADTNGYQVDRDREMYAWRDWVIEAFNANMKFDDFTIEQIAGDLLPNATISQKIATGFHRNHMMNEEGGVIAEEFLAEYCADRVETTAAVWLGQTFNCTRCHDHKFDPFTQKDFYGLYAFFHNVSEQGIGNYGANFRRNAPPFLTLPAPELVAKLEMLRTEQTDAQKTLTEIDARLMADYPAWEAGLKKLVTDGATTTPDKTAVPAEIAAILNKETASRSDAEKAMLVSYQQTTHPERKALAERIAGLPKLINDTEMSMPTALVMEELAAPRVTHILLRGEYNKLGEAVLANTPASLPAMSADLPRNRLGLAKWLTDPENPLTARVTVNRLWQSLFGVGLVRTSEDLGTQGELPSHPELLDWLAIELMESGWKMKSLHRLIVTSRTYRLASSAAASSSDVATAAANSKIDPENRALWRQNSHRMEAEIIRDATFYVAGQLDTTMYGADLDPAAGLTLARRSVYFRTSKEKKMTFLSTFDSANPVECYQRAESISPQQSLAMSNSPLTLAQSRILAEKLSEQVPADPSEETAASFIGLAFRHVLLRDPTAEERSECLAFLTQQSERFTAGSALTSFSGGTANPVKPSADALRRARENLVHVLMNHNDFVTIR